MLTHGYGWLRRGRGCSCQSGVGCGHSCAGTLISAGNKAAILNGYPAREITPLQCASVLARTLRCAQSSARRSNGDSRESLGERLQDFIPRLGSFFGTKFLIGICLCSVLGASYNWIESR